MTRTFIFTFLASTSLLCRAAPLNNGRRALSSSAAPLPSTTQQGATSTPTLTMVPAWANYQNGTIGYAVNQLLSGIGPDATQGWVTAEIASTQIGGPDPAGSNADLSQAVDVVFNGGKERWVDTYTDFLLEAGANASLPDNFFQQLNDTLEAWSEAQVKLVRAYGATHPANVTYVGIDVPGLARIPSTTLYDMQNWGATANCSSNSTSSNNATSNNNATSSGNTTLSNNATEDATQFPGGPENCTYSVEDDKAYLAAASAYFSLDIEFVNLTVMENMTYQSYQLKQTFQGFTQLGIFNLSMDTGGSGSNTQYAPAWSATVVGLANSSKTIESDLENGPTDSTENATIPVLGGFIKRNGTAGGGAQSTQGFDALQFIAHNTNPPTISMKPDDSTSVPAVASIAGATSVDPLAQPLGSDRRLVLLALQEGSWANNRDTYIQVTRRNYPGVVDKYFGSGSSGSGPIGRRWTHIVLSMVVDNTAQVSAELLGKVYEVLPVLST